MSIDWDNPYDGGRGETLDRELSRAIDPRRAPAVWTRKAIVSIPPLPAGIELPELRAAAAELERVRGVLSEATHAVAVAEAKRNGARVEDQARAAADFRAGKATTGPTAVSVLEAEITTLVARRDAGRVAVAQLEEELGATVERMRPVYLERVAAAVEAERAAAAMALDDYAASRTRLLDVMSLGGWLSGTERKWRATLPPLRLGSSDRPRPTGEQAIVALRAELD